LVSDQQRNAVRTDRRQRTVAERDLPAQAGKHGKAREYREVVRAVGKLQVVVGAELLGDDEQDERRQRRQCERPRERSARQVDARQSPHTLRSAVLENRPPGRTMSTASKITSAASVT